MFVFCRVVGWVGRVGRVGHRRRAATESEALVHHFRKESLPSGSPWTPCALVTLPDAARDFAAKSMAFSRVPLVGANALM